jgi:hypothetical protein
MKTKPFWSSLFCTKMLVFALVLAFFVPRTKASQKETKRAPANLIFCKDFFLEDKRIDPLSTFGNLPERNLSPMELRDLAAHVGKNHEAEIIRTLQSTPPNHEGRVFYKFFENENITVWAIEWEDNGTEIHDHLDSQVGIHVLRGNITEEHFEPPSAFSSPRVLSEGKSVGLDGTPYVHRISGTKGISIHIYSPPLKEMTYYEIENAELAPKGRWEDNTP